MIRANRAGYAQLSGCGLNLFTRDELDQIHYGTLEVLEQAGLMVFSDEAQEIYYSHGCKVDREKKIVKIPPYLVEEAIKSAPSKILLAGRDPKYDIVLEGTRVGFTSFGEGIKMLDMETGEIRESTKQDLVETAILCDALDNLDVFLVAVTPRDMPAVAQDLHAADAALNNTTKHFMNSILGTAETRRYVEMGAAIVGSKEELRRRPIISVGGDPVSPLQLSKEYSETIIESARAGIPCNILTMALSGSTTPVTMAGTLIVHNAEVLGGIVLSQLSSKGAPVIYGSSTTIFDLSCVNVPVGAPELAIIGAAVAKLAQYYNLPSFTAGG
jgi:trimethylamine--corrinoid protein Co-methyltransferase